MLFYCKFLTLGFKKNAARSLFLLYKWSYEEAEKLLDLLIVVKLQRKRDTKNLVKNYNLKIYKIR